MRSARQSPRINRESARRARRTVRYLHGVVSGYFYAVRELLDLALGLAEASDPGCDVAHITPLMHAVFAGQFAVAQLLLQRGATVGMNSARLVRAAANRGHEALTDLLLEYGANPAAIGAGVWVMYPAIADKLVARGANVN